MFYFSSPLHSCFIYFLPYILQIHMIIHYSVENMMLWFSKQGCIELCGLLCWFRRQSLPAVRETCIRSQGWEDPLEGNGYPLQYFCLENSMHSRTWHSISKNVSLKFYTLYINIYFVIISDLQESKNSIKNSHLYITQIPQMLIFHPCYIILPSIRIYTSIDIFP